MSKPTSYEIFSVPKLGSETETAAEKTALAEKFRALRLRALQTAADAFAMKYEDEVNRGLDHTLERMDNPKAVHFIGAKTDSANSYPTLEDDVERMLNCEWLGVIVLSGPQEAGAYDKSVSPFLHDLASPDAVHFHLGGMFVDPEARGAGLGKALIDSALQRAEAEAANLNKTLSASISVFEHNAVAKRLYERAGFQVKGTSPSRSKPGAVAVHLALKRGRDP